MKCDVAIIGCTTSRMLIHKLQYRNLLVHGINIHYPQHSHSHTYSFTFTHMLSYIHTHAQLHSHTHSFTIHQTCITDRCDHIRIDHNQSAFI